MSVPHDRVGQMVMGRLLRIASASQSMAMSLRHRALADVKLMRRVFPTLLRGVMLMGGVERPMDSIFQEGIS